MSERAKRVTLKHVADEVGLSVAAVSYALRGLQVPEETQQRVREAADRLGYQVDPIARALVSGRTGHVGVMCRSLTDLWQQGVAAALGRALMDEGRQALIVDASNDPLIEESLAAQLIDQRVDAIIVLPVDPSADHWATVAERTVLISIGDSIPGARTAAGVVFDNSSAVRGALETLANAGHRHIAVLTPDEADTPDRPAEVVTRRVADELGLDLALHTTPHELEGAKRVALEILGGGSPPTAFFCLSDSMAYGVYAAARTLGLDIPGDVSLLGSDDNQVSALLTPPLAGFHWPFDDLISSVVDLTLQSLESGARGGRRVLTATPTPGGSVAPPRPGSPAT
jgi:LacI family transcriptional regulator